jgi:hypothetical protein
MAGRGLLSACLGGAVASFGCSALLDLDVQYSDGGSKGEAGAANAADTSSEAHPDADSAATDAANRDDDRDVDSAMDSDVGTSPGVPDGSASDVSNESPPALPIQYVQGIAGTNDYVGATVTLTFKNPVALNDTILVAADGMAPMGIDVPTDTLGNPFSTASSVLNNTGNMSGSWIFYARVVTPGSDSITVVLPNNPSGQLLDAYAFEFSQVGALDGVNGKNGMTSDVHSGFVTTTAPGDLIFGYGVLYMGTCAPGTGFTALPTVHMNLTEYEIAQGPAGVEAAGTLVTGNMWTMMVAAFKAR